MKHKKLRALCEGAIMVALATALSYLKLLELPQGGSVCIGMLPIFLYSARWGVLARRSSRRLPMAFCSCCSTARMPGARRRCCWTICWRSACLA